MQNFADKLNSAIDQKGNPCVVGLDPRADQIPTCFGADIEEKIVAWSSTIIDTIKDLVPAVKIQIAFYEEHGTAGMKAFERTLKYAKDARLIVVIDAKRNDIGATAEAYARAYLGPTYDVDAITVSPFLGRDSITPFVDACKKYGKGIFVLVKTSNPGSGDIQDKISSGNSVSETVAKMVDELGSDLVGSSGYSSIGAVVGATFPEEATNLRALMPKAIFLVPGYGAQGGTAKNIVSCFNTDNKGALVNSSRGITFSHTGISISREDYCALVRANTEKMIADIVQVLGSRF